MKKAKIMLLAIAIVGVVGGALAFKAAKFTGPNWCVTKQIGTVYYATNTYTTVFNDKTTCTFGYKTTTATTTAFTVLDPSGVTHHLTIPATVYANIGE